MASQVSNNRANTRFSRVVTPSDPGIILIVSLRMSAKGKCIFDSWHMTLAEAKAQAEHEYAIADADWRELAG